MYQIALEPLISLYCFSIHFQFINIFLPLCARLESSQVYTIFTIYFRCTTKLQIFSESCQFIEHPNAAPRCHSHMAITIDNPLPKVQSVIFENIDAEAIHRAAMTTEGSA